MKSLKFGTRRFFAAALIGALVLSGLSVLEIARAPSASATLMNLDAPVISSVTSPTGNQLTVNFSAPTNSSGLSITSYQVEYSTNGTSWIVASNAVAANATSHAINGLSPNTAYYVRVAAFAGDLGAYGYDWKKIYSVSNPTRNANQQIVYDTGFGLGGSDAAATNANASYSRVRYRMQATYASQNNFVDANFSKNMTSLGTGSESFTTSANLSYLRVPSTDSNTANQFEIQGDVSDLTVLSNVAGVENGSEYSGRLELWPWNYDTPPNTGLSSTPRTNLTYDDGDSWASAGDYGSFQLHRLSSDSSKRRTVFAWNRHLSGSLAEIGFGDFGGANSDWTFASNSGYTARTGFNLTVFINATTSTLASTTVTYALNGGSGTTPSTATYSIGARYSLPSSTGFSRAGYNFAGWNNGISTFAAGTSLTAGALNTVMTAQWTSAIVLDYDVTDTASYTSGTTLTNRNSSYANASLTASSIFARGSQSLEFSGGTHGTVGSINAGLFNTALTIDIYGSLGSDSSSSWERFLDFGVAKGSGYADASYNFLVGRYASTNRIGLEFYNQNSGTTSNGICTSSADQLDNNMHRYTFVLSGSSCSLYVDGVLANVLNRDSGVAATSIAYGLPNNVTWNLAYLARSNWGYLGDAATTGKIRSLRLFSNALLPSAIDQVDSGRLVYKTVAYSSPETATLPASDVTTGTLRLPLASTATRTGFTLNNWFTSSGRSTVAAAPGGDFAVTTSTTLHAGWAGAASAQSALSVSSVSAQFGTPLTLTTSGGNGTGAVTYSVATGTATGCSITGGVLNFSSVGTCLVTATKAADANYLAASSSSTPVTISAKPVSVTAGNRAVNFGSTFTNTFTSGALAGADAISTLSYSYVGTGSTTYGPSSTAPTAVGTYSITPSGATLSAGTLSNYNFSYVAGTLTIAAQVLGEPGSVMSQTTAGVLKSIDVWWSAVANATNYTVKFTTGGVDVFTVDVNATSTTVADARFVNATSYIISVRANGSGNYASSAFGANTASSSTNNIYTITYVYNGADGANGTVSDSWIVNATAITLPTPTRTNFAFAGWFSNVGLTVPVTGTQTPFSSYSLYAKWTTSAYAITFNPNYGSTANSVQNLAVAVAATLPTPVRANFVLDGWYTAATGGTKVGNAGESFTPTQSTTLFARWIQASLYGIAPGNLTRVGTLTANGIVSTSFNGTLGGNTVTVTLPSATLPAGTIVALDLITDTSYAQSLLTGTNNYILSIAVSWLAPDETVPDTFSGKAVSMLIDNPSIKAGALVYGIQNGSVVLLGTATVDRFITVLLTSDPAVYLVSTVPSVPQQVATTVTETSATITWSAPSTSGGAVITGYTVSLNSGAVCTTTLLTCTFSNLTTGTSYTATIVATNSVGNSTTGSATFTPAAIAPPAQPPVIIPPIVVPPIVVPPIVPEQPPVTPVIPTKPFVGLVDFVRNIASVAANNVAKLVGSKISDPVQFNPNSTLLGATEKKSLRALAAGLAGQKGTVLVTGFVRYTSVGQSVMKRIATQRAKAVSMYLAALGVKANIGYVGYGAFNTKTPQASDRKVELRWVAAK